MHCLSGSWFGNDFRHHPCHLSNPFLCCSKTGALNFRDVMLAYGKLSKDLMSFGANSGNQIGLEFSGTVRCSQQPAQSLHVA